MSIPSLLIGLGLLWCFSLILLLVGLWTRLVSIIVSGIACFLMITAAGLGYSIGVSSLWLAIGLILLGAAIDLVRFLVRKRCF